MAGPFGRVPPRRRDTAGSLEVARIVALPVVPGLEPEAVEACNRMEVQADWYAKGFRLTAQQCESVLAFDTYGGVFSPMGVGSGKTLVTLMVADRAQRQGLRRSVLLIPPQVYGQLVNRDIGWARARVGLTVPFILLSGRSPNSRMAAARSGKVGCYVMPYSLLSARNAEEMLTAISPDVLILDEAHNVKNRSAARTGRLLRLLHQRREMGKRTRLVALSGTITSKSIRDYQHLIAPALGDSCPLPRDAALADEWSTALDAGADPSEAQTGPVRPLLDWARAHFPDQKVTEDVAGFRTAYRLRLNTCPGVVASSEEDIGTSLTLVNRPVPHPEKRQGYPEVLRLMDQVEELWRTPSGDDIEWGFHKWRYQYELTSGFYYHLRWPTVEELGRRGMGEDEALLRLDAAQRHHAALQEYHRALRRWLERRARPGLDTPFLVGASMLQHGPDEVGGALHETWEAARALEHDGMLERVSDPVKVCDYKVDAALKWAEGLDGTRTLWYHHRAVGDWLREEGRARGLDVLWCPSETERRGANEAICDPAQTAGKVVLASMGAHGTGKNLQHLQLQRLVEFPRKAVLLEQVLGRAHRKGQEADELCPETMNTLEFDHENMSAALIDSLYIHQTTGTRQKAIYASYDPLPRVYPPDFLRERGFTDVHLLDADARQALEQKFGPLVDPARGA